VSGAIGVQARDLTEPSPLALEVLSARPYAFLDDAPLEERRTQAVIARRWLDPQAASDIGKLDPAAIQRVREEAWPDAASLDELHDALLWLTFLTAEEVAANVHWASLLEQLARQGRVASLSLSQQLPALHVAAERVPLFRSLGATLLSTAIIVPPSHEKQWERADALEEIVRGRLTGLGPTTATLLAHPLGVSNIEGALLALEHEGSAMRGQFDGTLAAHTPGTPRETQWCDRRLLARIHRYTVKRLRAEIEPVQARDFLRFLFDWQRVTPTARMQGPDAVPAILGQLEGYEGAAGAWESEMLPARIAEYDPAWLDEQCLAGRIVWTRLSTRSSDGERGTAPVRATPIALLARRHLKFWSACSSPATTPQLTVRAEQAADFIRQQGASFFDEIAEGTRLLPTQVEEALAELVALGVVNSDSFGGLRALLVPSERRPAARDPRRRRRAIFSMQDAGRWGLVRRNEAVLSAVSQEARGDAVEHVCRTLLRRWGVVFWKLLQREADWLPPWRELLQCLRRLEARGEARGGRFVAGFSGEQFALPDAVAPLRDARRRPASEEYISLSAADPLNLVGILTPGPRLTSLTGNRVLYRDGIPLAVYAGGEVKFLETIEPSLQWQAQTALRRRLWHSPADPLESREPEERRE
jgi:ATP-dependent Lhr-like helicase